MTDTQSLQQLIDLRDQLRAKRYGDAKQARLIRLIGMGALVGLGLLAFFTGNLGFGLFIMLIGYFAVKWVSGALKKQANQAAQYKHDSALQAFLAPRVDFQQLEIKSFDVPFWRYIPKTIIPPSDEVETAGEVCFTTEKLVVDILTAKMTRRVADEPSLQVFSGTFVECELTNSSASELTIRPRQHYHRDALHTPYQDMTPARELSISALKQFEVFCDDPALVEGILSKKLCRLLQDNQTLALHYRSTLLTLAWAEHPPVLAQLNLDNDYGQPEMEEALDRLRKLSNLVVEICHEIQRV